MATEAKKLSQGTVVTTLGTDQYLIAVGGGQNLLITAANLLANALPELTLESLGLDRVDNTADADKPISTAQQVALTALSDSIQAFTQQLTALTDTVGEKADQSALDTLAQSVSQLVTGTQLTEAISDFVTNDALTAAITNFVTTAALTTALEGKADASAIQTLTQAVTAKVDQTAFDTLAGEVQSLNQAVAGKADSSEVTALAGVVSNKAEQADVDTLLESQDALAQAVTGLTQTKADQTAVDTLSQAVTALPPALTVAQIKEALMPVVEITDQIWNGGNVALPDAEVTVSVTNTLFTDLTYAELAIEYRELLDSEGPWIVATTYDFSDRNAVVEAHGFTLPAWGDFSVRTRLSSLYDTQLNQISNTVMIQKIALINVVSDAVVNTTDYEFGLNFEVVKTAYASYDPANGVVNFQYKLQGAADWTNVEVGPVLTAPTIVTVAGLATQPGNYQARLLITDTTNPGFSLTSNDYNVNIVA